MNEEQAKEKLSKIINSFPKHADHNEENLKFNYIEPLLMEILGWGRADIIKEQRVLKGRADYILKIGNEEVLVIEAKRPNVSLNEEEGRQAVSYAYHRKIKFAVLTNFKEIKVYHALSNIKNIDKNLLKFQDNSLFRISLGQFLTNFDKLSLLSKESFEKGEINKLLSKKDEKLSKPIDESILDNLLEIRRKLSNDLKHLRMHLTQEQIDEAVQILIDRLIFMRSVEDRGLEPMNFLLGIRKDYREGRLRKRLWDEFLILFKKFDGDYNSKLFASSILEDETIFFSDDVLQKVIYTLYFGTNEDQIRYKFDEIPGDLLGSIYEQYLGTVLQGTEKRVKLESESGKRKKMGIYYTPSYIVDYIVKNTVGEYIKDKTIDEILEVRILDPACGSGSFLTRAFQEVADAIEERLKKGEKSKKYQSFQIHNGRLSLGQKATILLNCIYGVDLDEKAVELTQLNLLLKLLEDETHETKRRILPNMKDNIKNGNSLIDDSKVAGDKAFKWEAQFPDVFRNGGFDVIIGNPPYVNNRGLSAKDKIFFEKIYSTAYQQYDLYVLFYELSFKILKEKGKLGFITPNKFAITNYGTPLRKLMLSYQIEKIVDVSQLNVFGEASTYPYVIIVQKSRPEKKAIFYLPDGRFENLRESMFDLSSFDYHKPMIFNANSGENELVDKISGENFIDIYRAKPTSKNIIEKGVSSVITNKEIDRFFIAHSDKKIENKKGWEIDIPAILMKKICFFPAASILNESKRIPINTVYVIHSTNKNIQLEYILGILNSKLIGYYSRKKFGATAMRGGFIELRTFEIKQLPIKFPSKSQEQKIVSLVDQMLALQKKLHEGKLAGGEKERLEQQIRNVDYEIDQEVYKLYGITKEEQKVIEESMQ